MRLLLYEDCLGCFRSEGILARSQDVLRLTLRRLFRLLPFFRSQGILRSIMRKYFWAVMRLRSQYARSQRLLSLVSLVPRSLPLEAHPCLQRPLSARSELSAPTGQSMHGMR